MIDNIVALCARLLSIAGGIALLGVCLVTTSSITGRLLIGFGLGPIPGDFELVELGVGFAVFAFLPWAQLHHSHATVDVFTIALPPKFNDLIDFVAEGLMTVFIILIAWRLWIGLSAKMHLHETTYILQIPVWWGFAAAMFTMIVGSITSIYVFCKAGAHLVRPNRSTSHHAAKSGELR